MNKKEIETFSLACAFLKLRGFQYWKEMYDILDKVTKREKRKKELSVEYTMKKRLTNKDYARSSEELKKRRYNKKIS